MAPSFLSIASVALILTTPLVNAHFQVLSPPTIGAFDDDSEGQSPCGGYTPDLSKATTITDFHVGGDSIVTKSSHSQQNWLYRITTDNTGGSNWTQIGDIFTQSGAGAYCNSKITVSDAWVGKTAILGIVGNAPDGLLYQCSAVRFVSGTGTPPSTCTTAQGVEVFGTTDSQLSGLVSGNASGNGTSTGTSPSGTASSATSTATTKATSTPGAAAGLTAQIGGVVGAVVVAAGWML